MKTNIFGITALCATSVLLVGVLASRVSAADSGEDPIKTVMKTYHKAPKGVDPLCKTAGDGKATPEDIKKLVAAYKTLTTAKPPQGELASWKEKTAKLLAAPEGLEKGVPEAAAKYKEAVNCKACHSVHRPQ